MQSQTVHQWALQYLNEGDGCLRRNRGQRVVEAIIAGQMSGLDVMSQLRMCMGEIETSSRLMRQLRAVRLGMIARLIVILLASLAVRCLLLLAIPDVSWVDLALADRAAWGALTLVSCCLIYLWHHWEQTSGNKRTVEKFLEIWFQDYMVLSPVGAGDHGLGQKLHAARIGEIIEGIDSLPLCRQLYLQTLSDRVYELRCQLDRWPMIIMSIEMAFFVLCSGGLVLIPFVAWLETASSGY